MRDVVKQLTQEQVLEQRSSKDVRVPVITKAAYVEILKIRLHLEELAAERATPAQQARLRKLLERNDRAAATKNHVLATQGNQGFHLALSEVADMPNLQSISIGLWLWMGRLIAGYYVTSTTGLNDKHYEVLQAMEAGDPATARTAIQANILEAKDALLNQIEAFTAATIE